MYHESHARDLRSIELADVPAAITVLFDPEHLQQVLFNLWDNSFEHGGASKRSITVLVQAGIEVDSGLPRTEGRRVGREGGSRCRSRRSPYPTKKNINCSHKDIRTDN